MSRTYAPSGAVCELAVLTRVATLAAGDEPEERTVQALREAPSEAARELIEVRAEHERRTSRSGIRKFKDYSEIAAYAGLKHGHFGLGARAFPRPGGRFPAESLNHGRRIDFEHAGRLPAEVLAVIAYDFDPYAVAASNRYTEEFITEDDVREAITGTRRGPTRRAWRVRRAARGS